MTLRHFFFIFLEIKHAFCAKIEAILISTKMFCVILHYYCVLSFNSIVFQNDFDYEFNFSKLKNNKNRVFNDECEKDCPTCHATGHVNYFIIIIVHRLCLPFFWLLNIYLGFKSCYYGIFPLLFLQTIRFLFIKSEFFSKFNKRIII